MEIENAKRLIPQWAEIEPVRVYEPKKKSGKPEPEKKQKRKPWYQLSLHLNIDGKRFGKRYGILLVAAAVFTVYTILLSAGVEARTTQRVTKQVKTDTEGEMRAGFAKWCSDHDIDPQSGEKIEKPLVDEESKQAQITALSKLFAEHIASLRMDRHVTKDGAITYIWGVDITRAESGRYGDMQSVLDGSVEGYVKGHPTRPEDDALGLEIATDYISGKRPDRWRPDLEFAVINADGSVTARNEHKTGPSTAYWWYGM